MEKKKTVLIAEDDLDVRMNLKLFFESNGYCCLEAVDGAEAIEQVKHHKPDLIVLDVMMPRLNGYQVCKSLKENPATKSIPVLMLTAKAEEADRFWGERVGADLYMTKPFDFEVLEKQIERLMKQRV